MPPQPYPESLSALLQAAFGTATDHFALLDPRGQIVWAGHSLAEFAGAPVESLVGRPFHALAVAVNRATPLDALVADVARTMQPVLVQAMARGPTGLRFIEYALSAVQLPAMEAGVLIVGRDVTARRQQLAVLRESEEFFRLLFEHGPVGVVIASADRRILRVNARFAEITGYSEAELSACRLDDLSSPDAFATELPQLARLGAGEIETYQAERQLLRKDGHAIWAQVTRAVVFDAEQQVLYIVSLTEDIHARRQAEAERRAMEERLRERQKLESLGVLAGGIAHDLNNLLVPILGNAELALKEFGADAPQHYLLEEIVLASQRAARLAQQMQAYSGRGHFVLASLDLSSVLLDMATVLRASVDPRATLRMETAAGLPTVQGDALQMRQIVFNLVQNAGEALGGRKGSITVSTGRRTLSRATLESLYVPADLPEGEYVYLRVSDTGEGMSNDVRARLFDPFLSTKGPGRGLGLPAVLGVVRGHGGALEVESAPGAGTTVTVYLPAIAQSRRASWPQNDLEVVPASASQSRGIVLVVDDDEGVSGLAELTLTRAGYHVRAIRDPAEALTFARTNRQQVSCVVLDLPLAQPGAVWDAFGELREPGPALPVVIIGIVHERAAVERLPRAVVLQRPFTPQTLRDAVERAVGSVRGV